MKTNELIAALSAEAPKTHLAGPRYYALRVIAVLAMYALGTQFVLGLRPDLAAQFLRPLFAVEILLLTVLALSSTWAAILSMYPDMYQQKRGLLNIPFAVFALLALFILLQLAMPHDLRMVMPQRNAHGLECALCIASVAVIPSAMLFALLRKGASVHPLRSGAYAALAATGIGGLTLRLSEANDALVHLAGWHYLPTLFCAAIGAWIGKTLLKW